LPQFPHFVTDFDEIRY